MNNNINNENNHYQPYGYNPPQPPQPPQEPVDSELYDHYSAQPYDPRIHSNTPEWSLPAHSEPRMDEWQEQQSYMEHVYSEPAYSAPHDMMANMYTPGINGHNAYAHNRNPVIDVEQPPKKRKSRVGAFFRALCLVLVCSLASAGATYAVMEYRISRGYHTTVNQVVLGGSGAIGQNGVTPTTVAITGTGMAAEDIYDMALTQVVGIRIDVPSMGIFGSINTNAATGTGFIISTDGYILTNYHVIEPAQTHNLPIVVVKSDGTEFEAEVVGYEVSNDVALIKIDATGLNPAILGNSDNIRVGQSVFAIGNPFGNLVYTMTDGIVSALDRDVTVEGKIINTFQFSAAVNRGNSGGPVYDANGEVIGIVTAKLMRGEVEGIGFAIPINDAIEIASGLIEHGYIAGRPLIGITGQTVTRGSADYYGWVVGVLVRDVNPDSAADNAGLQSGDIIVGLGNSEITSMETLRFAMRRYRAGDTANLSVWRDEHVRQMTITFDEDFAAGQPGRSSRVETETPRQMPWPMP